VTLILDPQAYLDFFGIELHCSGAEVSLDPDWWCNFNSSHPECDVEHAKIQAELEIEIHPEHPFYGRKLKVIAHAMGNDDVLCTHVDDPKRYSVLHLTWAGRPELGSCPTIDFDGNLPDSNEDASG